MPIPHIKSRLAQQLKYIENMNVRDLAQHSPSFRKIFMKLLHLQVKLPDNTRLYLLLESEHPPVSGNTISDFDLFSLFSTTIYNESKDHRENVDELGELLVDFKANCGVPREVPDGQSKPNLASSSTETVGIAAGQDDPPLRTALRTQRSDQGTTTNNHETRNSVLPAPTGVNEEDRDDRNVENDDSDINWKVVPEDVIEAMVLPPWFPSPHREFTPLFKESTFRVDIDKFHHMNHKQTTFVYSSLFRTAHRK